MRDLKAKESKKDFNCKMPFENLYKGSCVKIKNSKKTFQVIGINPEKKICWLREWPFSSEFYRTFSLDFSQITLQIICRNQLSE